jgi:hypothetical protein
MTPKGKRQKAKATTVTSQLRANQKASSHRALQCMNTASASQASRRLGVWVGAADDFLYTV